jgi:hypothetical protein
MDVQIVLIHADGGVIRHVTGNVSITAVIDVLAHVVVLAQHS